jgi:hypothetical protein
MEVRSLMIHADKVPRGLPLFRLDETPDRILVHTDLVAAIKQAKLTGFHAVDLGQPLI